MKECWWAGEFYEKERLDFRCSYYSCGSYYVHCNECHAIRWWYGCKDNIDGKEYGTYSLDEDREIEIKTDNGNNKVEIHDKSVEMKEADCPDKYCVKQGKINKIRQNIVCLPHKIVVEIISADSSKQNEADAIAK